MKLNHSIKKQHSLMRDIFTDREKCTKVFDRYLNAAGSENLKVLVFYGVGGIGKTKLQIKLMELLKNSKTPIPYATFDLEKTIGKANVYREVFLSMERDLKEKFKISFKTFDPCWAVIAAREGGEPEPLLHNTNPFLANLLKLAVSLGGAPADEISSLIGGLIRKSSWEKQIRSILKTGDVVELRSMDDKLLISEFFHRFVNDLNESLTGRENKACKGVLFLDTYEALWARHDGGKSAQARLLDEWVRELVGLCLGAGVLLVISGRERLTWDEDYPEHWHETLDQHLLGGLSEMDAQKFLSQCDIGHTTAQGIPSPLQEAIIKYSNEEASTSSEISCHPLYLVMCAEIVQNERLSRGKDPHPDTFSVIPLDKARKLADRFLKSLYNPKMEMWVEELSLTPRFDEKAALALDRGRYIGNSRAGWERLTGFSFMQPQPDGFYQVHKTMKDALVSRLTKEYSQAVHEWFCNYWNERKEAELKSYHQWILLDILNKNEIVPDKYFNLILKIYNNGSEDIKKLAIGSLNKKKEIDIDRTYTIIEEIINKDEKTDVTYFAIYNLIDFINYSSEKVLNILNEIITNPKNTKYVYAILNRLQDPNFKQAGTISVLRKIINSNSADINLNQKRIAYNTLQGWGYEVPEINKFDPIMFKKMSVKEISEFIDNYISSHKKNVFINEHLLNFILCELYKINPYVSFEIMKKSLTIPALANFEPIAEVLANPVYYDANIINNFLAEKNEWILRFTGFMALEFNINNEFKGATVEQHEKTKNTSISIIKNLLNDRDQFLKKIARAAYNRTTRVKENNNEKIIDKIKYRFEDNMIKLGTNLKVNNIIDLKMTKGYVEAEFELTTRQQALFFWLLYNSTLPDSDPKDTLGLLFAIERHGIIEKNIVQFVYQKVKNDPCGALQILEKVGIKSNDFMTKLGAIVGIDIIGRRCPQKALEILDSALPVMNRELKFIYIVSGSTGLLRNFRNEPDSHFKEKSRDILQKLKQDEDSDISFLADMVMNGIQFRGS